MQFQFQTFVSQMVTMALPIIIVIALIIFICLKKSYLNVLILFMYLVLAGLFSYGFYSNPESWTSEPDITTAILYGSAIAATFFGFTWIFFYSITSVIGKLNTELEVKMEQDRLNKKS